MEFMQLSMEILIIKMSPNKQQILQRRERLSMWPLVMLQASIFTFISKNDKFSV